MMSRLSGHDSAMRRTLSGMVERMLLVGMLMMPGRQYWYAIWQSSTTPWNMNGSPPLTVNQ